MGTLKTDVLLQYISNYISVQTLNQSVEWWPSELVWNNTLYVYGTYGDQKSVCFSCAWSVTSVLQDRT